LYHYTSTDGLHGIVSSGELWATKIRYLNDSSELMHALEIGTTYLQLLLTAKAYPESVLYDVMNRTRTSTDLNICIVSFSENGDLLSQWRAYSGNSSGFSIGFNTQKLEKIANENGMYLCKCIYNPKIQADVIKEYFDSILPELQQNSDQEFWGTKIAEFFRIASLIKNVNFIEENEWRLISKPKSCKLPNFQFRKSETTLVPYYSVLFEKEDISTVFKEIICGPSPNYLLSQPALQMFLIKYGFGDRNVKNSKIPLRQI
jgi:hypothetical protein